MAGASNRCCEVITTLQQFPVKRNLAPLSAVHKTFSFKLFVVGWCASDSKKIRGVDSVSVTCSNEGRNLKDAASWQPFLPSLVLIAFDRYLLST